MTQKQDKLISQANTRLIPLLPHTGSHDQNFPVLRLLWRPDQLVNNISKLFRVSWIKNIDYVRREKPKVDYYGTKTLLINSGGAQVFCPSCVTDRTGTMGEDWEVKPDADCPWTETE